MAKVKISCNPKNKSIEYARLNSKTGEWESIDSKTHAESKLLSKELSQDFSAINANKILDTIIEEYNDSHLDLVFVGSENEFIILNSICKSKKYSSMVSLSRESQEPKKASVTAGNKAKNEKTKLRNKRLHISTTDYFIALGVMGVLIFGAYFLSQYLDVKKDYNIKFTSVDFIISAPNKEQVQEIAELSHVKTVVPYVFRNVEVSKVNKSYETNLYLIENESDLPLTVFSDKLLLKKSSEMTSNALYISDSFSNALKINLNDELEISIDGSTVKFRVAGIYKNDYRNVGGTIIAIINNDVVTALKGAYRYNGAYICSSDVGKTRSYLENYQSLGDLRSKEEFSSEEAYNIYLEEKKSDKGNVLFDREKYLSNVGKRNDSRLIRNLVLAISCSITALLIVCVSVYIRLVGYIKKHADNDMRNSFTLKQERAMFKSFCISEILILFLAYIISLLVSWIVFKIPVVSILSLLGIIVLVVFIFIEYYVAMAKLNAVFVKKVKNQEEKK